MPLLLLLTGSSADMESEKFKRRYPHSYKMMQDAKAQAQEIPTIREIEDEIKGKGKNEG